MGKKIASCHQFLDIPTVCRYQLPKKYSNPNRHSPEKYDFKINSNSKSFTFKVRCPFQKIRFYDCSLDKTGKADLIINCCCCSLCKCYSELYILPAFSLHHLWYSPAALMGNLSLLNQQKTNQRKGEKVRNHK